MVEISSCKNCTQYDSHGLINKGLQKNKDQKECFETRAREYFMLRVHNCLNGSKWASLWHGEDLDESAASMVIAAWNLRRNFA